MRNQTIDIAKGIGILLVVFSHNWTIFLIKGELFYTIYSFQLLLFFYLAGLFYRHGSFTDLLSSKADSLLKPYFVVLIWVGIFRALTGTPFTVQYFLGILYANGNVITYNAMWYIPHLFAIFLFVWVIHETVTKYFGGNTKILWGLAPAFLLLGGLPMELFWDKPLASNLLTVSFFGENPYLPGLPFNVEIIFITSGYFLLGYLTSNRALSFKVNWLWLGVSLVTFSGLHYFFNEYQDLDLRRYGNPIICMLQAVSAFYIVLCISNFLTFFQPAAKTLTYLGSASLIILIFHARPQDVAYIFLLGKIPEHPLWAAAASFIPALIFPIAIFELTKRSTWLSRLLLPIKRDKQKA